MKRYKDKEDYVFGLVEKLGYEGEKDRIAILEYMKTTWHLVPNIDLYIDMDRCWYWRAKPKWVHWNGISLKTLEEKSKPWYTGWRVCHSLWRHYKDDPHWKKENNYSEFSKHFEANSREGIEWRVICIFAEHLLKVPKEGRLGHIMPHSIGHPLVAKCFHQFTDW